VPPVKASAAKKGRRAGTERVPLERLWAYEAGDYPRALDWSVDGATLALGTADGSLRLLEVGKGALVHTLTHGGPLTAVRWSPRADLLAASSEDGLCRVWSAAGELVAQLRGRGGAWVEHVAWAPDGERLAMAAGRTVGVFTPRGEQVLETPPHPSAVAGLAWGPKGDTVAAAAYGGVHLWPIPGGAPAQHLPWSGSLISLAWSPDGEVLACGTQECSVHFWRLGPRTDAEMSGYPAKPRELAWSADSRLLATGGEANICVWRFEAGGPEGKRPLMLKGHEALLTALDFGPAGNLLASGAKDRQVRLWRPDAGPSAVGLASMGAEVGLLRFSRDGRLLAGVDVSGHLVVWRVGAGPG
jgi:WD40 repeat protein